MKVKNKKFVNIITRNNEGIALITVILIIAILGILAAVAIETTGSDIINAGNYTASSQIFNIGNSFMNLVLDQIGTNTDTDAGVGVSGIPLANTYYKNGAIDPQQSWNLMQSDLTTAYSGYLSFNNCNNAAGPEFAFEYYGTYGTPHGYGNNFEFYIGTIQSISQGNCVSINKNNLHTAGMTFDYGPFPVINGTEY